MVANRAGAEVQNCCNLFRRLSPTDQIEDLPLSWRKSVPITQHPVVLIEIPQKQILYLCGHQSLPIRTLGIALGSAKTSRRRRRTQASVCSPDVGSTT